MVFDNCGVSGGLKALLLSPTYLVNFHAVVSFYMEFIRPGVNCILNCSPLQKMGKRAIFHSPQKPCAKFSTGSEKTKGFTINGCKYINNDRYFNCVVRIAYCCVSNY